jgi:Na+(H+)/acetate symporter ActP
MTRADFDAVAEKSRKTILWVQIAEGALLVVAAAVIVVLVLVVDGQREQISRQQHQIALQAVALQADAHRVRAALCDSQFTIGTAQLPPPGSKVGVEFVEASRKAFVLLGCPGKLGNPPHSLVDMGKKFGVALRF